MHPIDGCSTYGGGFGCGPNIKDVRGHVVIKEFMLHKIKLTTKSNSLINKNNISFIVFFQRL